MIIFLDYPEWIESFYEAIHGPILTTSLAHFPHTGIVFSVFIVLCLASLIRRRFWCRYLCPLGAFLAIPAVHCWDGEKSAEGTQVAAPETAPYQGGEA